MASVIGAISNGYNRFLAAGDPRVEKLLLMQSPLPTILICIVYVYFVLSLGPRLMRNRKPFELRNLLIVYNAGQTLFSVVMFVIAAIQWVKIAGWGTDCAEVDYTSQNPDDIWITRLCHAYYLSKISELADTVFFVLKKKNKHISLLHVFHHAAMPFSVWFGVKFSAGGNLAFFGLPNLFVHIWMYMYYMLAAMGPQYQKYIWWKRHITEMQLAQFGIVMFYMLYVACACQFNKVWIIWIFAMDFIFVYLFVDFYRKTYTRNKLRKEATAVTNGVANGVAVNGGDAVAHMNGYSKPTTSGVSEIPANGSANGSAKKID